MKNSPGSFREKIMPLLIGLFVVGLFFFLKEEPHQGDKSTLDPMPSQGQGLDPEGMIHQMDSFELIEYGMYEELNIFLSNFSETGLESFGVESPTKDLFYFASAHTKLNYSNPLEARAGQDPYLSKHFSKEKLGEKINHYLKLDVFTREDFYSLGSSGDYEEELASNGAQVKAIERPEEIYFVSPSRGDYKSTFVLVDKLRRFQDDIIEVEFRNYSNEARKYDTSPSTGIYKLLAEDAQKNFNLVGKGRARVQLKGAEGSYKLIEYKAEIK